MSRYLAILMCLGLVIGCSTPRSERTEEERAIREELSTDLPQQHKDPDGAFGAKDFASEAREESNNSTKALESAAEEIQSEQPNEEP